MPATFWDFFVLKVDRVETTQHLFPHFFTSHQRTRDIMSETKVYTWDELRSEEAKSKEGILMLLHGKGKLHSLLCSPVELANLSCAIVYAIGKFLDEVRSTLCSRDRIDTEANASPFTTLCFAYLAPRRRRGIVWRSWKGCHGSVRRCGTLG